MVTQYKYYHDVKMLKSTLLFMFGNTKWHNLLRFDDKISQ